MNSQLRAIPIVLALAVLGSGCVVYNEECSPLVSTPDAITGWLGGDVATTKPEVRTRDNPLGQLVAEAYYFAFEGSATGKRPDLGLENAGSIRSEGLCSTHEVLRKGAVKRKVLREVLPFDDTVVVVSVTHRQLKNIFEHAVAGLSPTGAASPPGAFLQIYGGTVAADCRLPGEKLKADGSRDQEGQRITAITLQGTTGAKELPLHPPSDTEKVRIAINSYLLEGGDSFVDLKGLDRNAPDVLRSGSYNFEVIAEHFRKTYTENRPLPAAPRASWLLTECR